ATGLQSDRNGRGRVHVQGIQPAVSWDEAAIMLIQPIDYFLIAWFAIAAASTLYVGIDQYRNNPEPVVMKWGFILVTLYMGPLGLLLYVL
ncbi:MAG: hypothetical protein E5V42_02400, partial [Mesorhizobium sp.]